MFELYEMPVHTLWTTGTSTDFMSRTYITIYIKTYLNFITHTYLDTISVPASG